MGANHVRKEVQRYLSEDVDRRVSFIQQELWIDYKTSEAVFRIMNNMSEVPLRPNAPALLVVGPGGSGKSAIISQIPHRVKNSKGLIVVSMAESPEIYIKKTLRSELSAALGLPSSQASGLKGAADIPNELREVIKLRRVWGPVFVNVVVA